MIKACVIGYPIHHSRSPVLHNYWVKQYGLEACYAAESISPDGLRRFMDAIRDGTSAYSGGNATIPHKETLLQLADKSDDTATILGAANTYWVENNELHVTNTDTYGFLANLDAGAPNWDTLDTSRAGRAVVLGAGGAARAIIYGLITRGFTSIALANRTVSRAENLARHFSSITKKSGCKITPMTSDDAETALADATLLVNTTSLGMIGQPDLKFSLSQLPSSTLVTDIVYTPLETNLLKSAKLRGNKTVDGLGMLLHQAVPGFEKWFGVRPQVTDDLRVHMLGDHPEETNEADV